MIAENVNVVDIILEDGPFAVPNINEARFAVCDRAHPLHSIEDPAVLGYYLLVVHFCLVLLGVFQVLLIVPLLHAVGVASEDHNLASDDHIVDYEQMASELDLY